MKKIIKRENYVTIQGWMVTDLNLKGNELLVYAIIYGFSQNRDNQYTGSAQYLADWCNTSRQTVHSVLKGLVSKGLIEKEEHFENGVKFCNYKVSDLIGCQESLQGDVKNFDRGVSKNLTGGYQESLHHNIDTYSSKDNIDTYSSKYIVEIETIIDYLNFKTGSSFRPKTAKTQSLIKARLKEGFTIDDFKTVIDKKCIEWKGTEWEKYLRPETLFGTKFESYLNQRMNTSSGDIFDAILKGEVVYETDGNSSYIEDSENDISLPF